MALSSEELQRIKQEVLAALGTNTLDINQLTPVDNLTDNDSIELSGGKRVTYATMTKFMSALARGEAEEVAKLLKLPVEQELTDAEDKVPSSKAVLDAIANRAEGFIGYAQVKQYLKANYETLRSLSSPHIFQLMAGLRNVGLLMVIGDSSQTTLNLLLFTRQNVSGAEIQNTFVNGLPKLYTGAYVFTTDYMSDWKEVSGSDGSGSTGSSGGGSSDLKKYSIWIESRESEPEDGSSTEPAWIVTEISSGLREALNKDPQNSIVELCVNLGFDFAFKVPAVTTSTETGTGGVMVMATIGGKTFIVTVDDDPEQCQVSVEESEASDSTGCLKGIRTYNGNTLNADENGYISTKYGDIYFDKANDEAYQSFLELKVNPNGSIETKTAIVTPDTDSLQAEAGKLYRFDNEVNTLAVSLPDMDGSQYAADIMFHFTTGSAPQLTIDSKGADLFYSRDFKIEADSTYEMSLLWDGTAWWAASEKNTKDKQS